jgi:hypothetical protein
MIGWTALLNDASKGSWIASWEVALGTYLPGRFDLLGEYHSIAEYIRVRE